ncbi:MAG: hypothetical protein R3D67_08810 [Hyphomicrobiaceae bacterium]
MRLRALTTRLLLAAVLLVTGSLVSPLFAASSEIFASLERPPIPAEVEALLVRGVRLFDFDLDQKGAAASAAAIKAGGAKISAYHIGGGGGRAWGSVKAGEFVRYYNDPKSFLALTADVRRLVGLGADVIHFDNTHRMSGRRLEAVADAIVAGGAGFVAKNNPDKWRLVMERRPDLKPAYALVEDAMFDADETQAAYELFAKGVEVYIVGFRKPIEPDVPAVTDAYAEAYERVNPWCHVILMDDEQYFDTRTARFIE